MNIDVKGKRVALIGGAGFIGHNLALKLKELGAEPHVLDSLQVNNLGVFTSGQSGAEHEQLYVKFINERLDLLRANEIPLHIVDAREYSLLSLHLSQLKPDVVIHLAAIAHANRANKDPYHTFDHSMRTLENALDAVREDKPHFIYFSSSMVYGNFPEGFVTEESPCNPLGIYAALKFSGEKLVIAYNQVFDLPYTIVRPSALYGERCVSRRVGQAFIENAIMGNGLTVNGDGSDALDFTYVQDLIQGICLCVAKEEARGEAFNLTYGKGRSLAELAAIVQDEFPGISLQKQPRDKLMPKRGTLSIEKAQRLLGYDPQHPIETGFKNYVSWYKGLKENHPKYFDK